MKLNSIVYDYSSLQSAITTQLNSESTTFKAIYPSDTATSLVNVLASYGSMLQYQLVSAMANMYTDSAYSEAGIHQLAETLGNRLHGNISSQIYCDITRTNLEGRTITIPAGSKFTVENLNFFNPETIVFPISVNTIPNVKLIQGVKLVSEQISSGISGEKLYFCDDFRCNTNLVRVFVDDEEWNTTDSFLPYVITDESIAAKSQVLILKTDPDGRTYIKFGNNTNGRIPDKGSVIRIEYVANEGADGNLDNNNLTIKLSSPIYYTKSPGLREQLQVDITAVSTASGGFGTQSIEVLKESSPYVFASGQRAVRRNDYKAMLLNQCGYLTCNVWGEYEEAAINGGYDKIMMNMVYYTGVKSIHKYDLQPITTVELDRIQLRTYATTTYPIQGYIESARGFLGSYIIDISSYDITGIPMTVKYCDKQGTGILTCDPSTNEALIQNDPDLDFDTDIYPVNDFLTDKGTDNLYTFRIGINQRPANAGDPVLEETDTQRTVQLVEGTADWTSTGKDIYGADALINFDNPFQFRVNFNTRTTVCAFAFKTPVKESYNNFIHKFAIYGTNADIPDDISGETYYYNVKNMDDWTKLTGIQTIDKELEEHTFSDWTTLKVYNPDTSIEERENVTSTEATGTFWITPDHSGEDYEYIITVNGEVRASNEYDVFYEQTDATHYRQTKIVFKNGVTFPANTPVVIDCILYDWSKFKHYVIEVYGIHNTADKLPSTVSVGQIKAIYKKSASVINYNNNNEVTLNVPLKGTTNAKTICLPSKMTFYKYNVIVNNVDDDHKYNTTERLSWTSDINGSSYTFTVTPTNIGAQQFKITVSTEGKPESEILRGFDKITITGGELIGSGEYKGGTITITSEPTVDICGSYTGNFYTNKDIQAADLPVLNKYNHFTTYVEFRQPLIKNIMIELNVEYENNTSYQVVRNDIVTAVNSLFELHPYSIGSSLNVSDIWKAVNTVEGVKRFSVLTPLDNIDCLPYELLMLPAENLIINDILNSEYK